MGETTVKLPWPDIALNGHAKGKHWHKKADATKKARHQAWVLSKAARVQHDPNAILEITYHPPDRRRRDCQNMPAMLKAAIDGIADAMGCDDHKFRVRYPDKFSDVVKGGCVLVHIKPWVSE